MTLQFHQPLSPQLTIDETFAFSSALKISTISTIKNCFLRTSPFSLDSESDDYFEVFSNFFIVKW